MISLTTYIKVIEIGGGSLIPYSYLCLIITQKRNDGFLYFFYADQICYLINGRNNENRLACKIKGLER